MNNATYTLALLGDNDRLLGTFPIQQARFTLGAMVNPDNRDTDPARFLSLFGEDARQVAIAKTLTMHITNLQADYPDVELSLDFDLENEPEVDVDALVYWVKQQTSLDLDTLSDKNFTLTVAQAAPRFVPN
jgi:hypothetical protein